MVHRPCGAWGCKKTVRWYQKQEQTVDALVNPGYRGWYLRYLIVVLWPTSASNYHCYWGLSQHFILRGPMKGVFPTPDTGPFVPTLMSADYYTQNWWSDTFSFPSRCWTLHKMTPGTQTPFMGPIKGSTINHLKGPWCKTKFKWLKWMKDSAVHQPCKK